MPLLFHLFLVIFYCTGFQHGPNGHGICSDGAGGSGGCTCVTGWLGRSCDIQCPGDDALPCGGHGTCQLQLGAASESVAVCRCDGSWYGPACGEVAQEAATLCHSYFFTNSLLPEQARGILSTTSQQICFGCFPSPSLLHSPA